MPSKALVFAGMFIGSTLGGLIPEIWGADAFSVWSIILGAVGGLAGIWAVYRISNN